MEKIKEETKAFKKLCIIKLCVFPIEYILTRLISGNIEAKIKLDIIKISIKLLRNKINIYEFQNELTTLSLGFNV